MTDVKLNVNGVSYGGWKSLRAARGIEQIAGTFELGVSELWPAQRIIRQIAPLDKCELAIDGETIITGHVDDVRVSYRADMHEVQIEGRDATADLVDCSAIYKTGQWVRQKMERIADDLLKPFGIKVRAEVDTGNAIVWDIYQGESVFENLHRLALQKAVLLTSDGAGSLVITRAGKGGRVARGLELGKNIKEADLELSFRDRFSQYIVKGFGAEGDSSFGDANRMKATAADAMVGRYRPLVIVAEEAVDPVACKRRAEWEANVRAGKSAQISVIVQGWKHDAGLWQPNTIVRVRDEWLRTEADMLIKGVLFVLDDGGTTTRLQLTVPQAFDLITMPKKADPWEMFGRQQREIDRLKRQQERKRGTQ